MIYVFVHSSRIDVFFVILKLTVAEVDQLCQDIPVLCVMNTKYFPEESL